MKFWMLLPAVSFAFFFTALLMGALLGAGLNSKYRELPLKRRKFVLGFIAALQLVLLGNAAWSIHARTHRYEAGIAPMAAERASFAYRARVDAACMKSSRDALIQKKRQPSPQDLVHFRNYCSCMSKAMWDVSVQSEKGDSPAARQASSRKAVADWLVSTPGKTARDSCGRT
jgi:hypothetical protein